MMFIETRYFNTGTVMARMTDHTPEQIPSSEYDFYVDEIGGDGEMYWDLEEWLENLTIEHDDVVPLVFTLQAGEWADISCFC